MAIAIGHVGDAEARSQTKPKEPSDVRENCVARNAVTTGPRGAPNRTESGALHAWWRVVWTAREWKWASRGMSRHSPRSEVKLWLGGRARALRFVAAALIAISVSIANPAMAAAGAKWTVGRAAIQADPSGPGKPPQVKLSLRNQGQPDQSPVQLAGRWVPEKQPPRKITQQELPSFVLLGRFQKEVAMKHTAIIASSLGPLGRSPAGHAVELVVLTGPAITDQGRVSLH